MLTSMRKNKKFLNIFLWLVIFAFLATIVVVWGLGENQTDQNYVAKIDNRVVSYQEYRNTYEQIVQQMRSLFGEASDTLIQQDPNFGQTVLDNIISTHLLLEEAERLKIPMGDAEVVNAIVNTPLFHNNGVFDIELYQEILAANGLAPAAYEAQIRREITLNKLRSIIDGTVAVTDEEILNEYNYQNTRLTASYFSVPSQSYLDEVTVQEDALRDFYSNNGENYRLPAQIKLKYITFIPQEFQFVSTLTEEDVRARYSATLANYIQPEMMDLRQIAVFVNDWDNEAMANQAEEKINRAMEELNAGKSFEEVAAEYSEDTASALDGGSIGTVIRPYGNLTPEEEIVFELAAGQTTGVIKSDFGYYIFKADTHVEEKLQSFEDIKENLLTAMENEARNSAYRSYLYGIYREILSAGNISAYMQNNPDRFTVTETGFISQNDPSSFIQTDADLRNTLFGLGKTEISPLMEYGNTTRIYEITDKINSTLPAFEEVRENIEQDYRNYAAFNLAAADVKNRLSASSMSIEEFQDTARAFNASVSDIPSFSRMDARPEMIWADEMAEELFRNNAGNVIIYPVESLGLTYVIRVDDVLRPDRTELESVREALEVYLLNTKRTDAMNGFIADLKKKRKVVINPNFTGDRY